MTTVTATSSGRDGNDVPWRFVFELARRELRDGLAGFYVFIACLALGVAAITGVGALSDALRAGFERQGEMILGGDATFARSHTRATDNERAWFNGNGRMSETATLRTMARRLDGEDQALIEVKAVDAAYPMAGEVKVKDGAPYAEAVKRGAIADPVLLERLGIKVGDKIRIGAYDIEIAAVLVSEPDGLMDRLTYGPRVFVSIETLQATALLQPGTLVRWRYALRLGDRSAASPTGLKTFRDQAQKALPEAGFVVADRRDPSPQVSRTIERLRQFLTLLGLTSLMVGGVGVANAVSTFIDRRRTVIATMKSLGAPSRTIFAVFLTQVMAMATAGILIGLLAGLIVPGALASAFGDALPIKPEFDLSFGSVAAAVAYGILVTLLFALVPLGRAEKVSPSVLFRDEIAPQSVRLAPRILWMLALSAAALVAFAILTSDSKRIALFFCAGLVLVFGTFVALAHAVTWAARRVRRRPRQPSLALALANLAAPGGLARSVVISLGSGLSLLVAVALADSSLIDELSDRLPEQSPNYFLLDIAKADYQGLKGVVAAQFPAAKLYDAPMLRGRLITLNGKPVEQVKAPPEAQWVLSGDRGLTYSETVPEGSKVTAGTWWGSGYEGPPLVSFESELAEQLGLKLGDSVTVNVLGRNLTAKISNLREVKWESLALNFVMVFSPNTLQGAPHNLLATVTLPKDTSAADEARLAKTIGKAYPSVTTIRVKDAINAFNAVFSKVMTAVRAAGSVTLLAGALVLAGALATAQRRRIVEAVILKSLGATRWQILKAHLVEYAILAAAAGVFAVLLGTLAAWVAVTHVMEIDFAFSWAAVLTALGLAGGLVGLFGSAGTWIALNARPTAILRSE